MKSAIAVPASLFTLDAKGGIQGGQEITYGAELNQLYQVPQSSTLIAQKKQKTYVVLSGLSIPEMVDVYPELSGFTSGKILSLQGAHIHKFHTPLFMNMVLRGLQKSYTIPVRSLPYNPVKEVEKKFHAVSVNINPNLASPTFGIDVEHLSVFQEVIRELEKKGIPVEVNQVDIETQRKAKQELLKSLFRVQAIKNGGKILVKVSYNREKDTNGTLTVVQNEAEIDREYLEPNSHSEFLWADQSQLFQIFFSEEK